MKKYIFVSILLLSLLAPGGLAQAAYNTYSWGPGTRFYFGGVAARLGESAGISIDVASNSYVHSYILDNASLRVTMYPGSEIHLKSTDRKLFVTNIETAETVCADGYSTWDYSTPDKTVTVIITFSDDGNCVESSQALTTENGSGENKTARQVDLFELDEEKAVSGFKQNDQLSFIRYNIMEVVTVKSVGSQTVTINVSKLDKDYTIEVGHWVNIDIDGDGYRDAKILLKGINAADGGAEISLAPIAVVKITGAQPGDLIKVEDSPAVYYLGEDGQRYVFPNQKVFFSWYDNFDKVKIISVAEMAKLPIAGLITYRPGVKLVTFTTTKDVYVVAKGGMLRKLRDEAMARELYGDNWNKLVDDINDAFYSSYSFGDDLLTVADYDKEVAKQTDYNITIDKDI